MLGFLVNYAKTKAASPAALMETFSPQQLTMLSGLAANFAVSDAWFALGALRDLAESRVCSSGDLVRPCEQLALRSIRF